MRRTTMRSELVSTDISCRGDTDTGATRGHLAGQLDNGGRFASSPSASPSSRHHD